jgi:hypothetical protein
MSRYVTEKPENAQNLVFSLENPPPKNSYFM